MEPKLLLILALVAGTYAVPTIRESCSTTCTGTNKFGYQPGTTYEFDYDVDTATLLQGASEGLSGMKMSAKVKLEVLSKCDLVLQVEGVSLKERNPSLPESFLLSAANSEFKQALEEHPLRFSFQDGRIDSLCPSEGDKSWVLNIKRGILSMIQNTMDDLSADQKVKETDVAGTCDADYTVEKNGWYSVTIKKNKNLLGCTERHSVNTAIQGTPYNVPSDIQSLPIMKSLHECQQEVSKSGILKSSTCSESHIFRPFSREESGAVTKSKQTLKYVRESSGVSSPRNVKSKTNMVFEHSYDPAKEQKTRRQIMDTLKAICVSTKEGVRQETPRLFAELVSSLKSVDASTIKSLYETVKSGSVCTDNNERVRKFFLDAIPMVGTSSSVHMLVKLITDNEITGTEADMWMTTLSFIQRPTKEMLNELKQLATRNGKSMLAVSSLLNNYCKSTSCELDMDIRDIVSALENKIGYGCYVDDNNVENVVVTLRALGNAGYISNVLPTINSCLTRKENPMEVRIAAAESFRRASCDTDKSDIEGIFKNVEEDSELRIAAYLALMECPSDAVLRTVKITLENEEVNQVGSFVWSHLTNLMETSNPLKQEVRSIIEDETLKKEFDLDKRKFSRNYEWSFFLDKLNTGASVESNMIWSSKSFIPRSLMANLTVDLFGQSINLLEVGGRIEGLEYFLETYFGPNGYFAEKTVKEATKQVVKGIDSRKMNKLDLQFASEMDKLKGTLYMRIFGNDIRYKSFRGSQDLFSGSNINILELLISLSKQHDYTFTQNVMFLDSGIIIPTAAGFPMNLTLNGTATMDFTASGKIDLRKLGTSPRSLIISGLVRPSAAIEITSLMSVDAFVAKSGLKMVSTLHSSTQLKGQVSLKDGQIFNAEWEPSDKTEILSVKSSFYTVHRDEEREQKMITENRKSHQLCTGSKLAIMTGLELCGVMEFPNASMKADAPYFPLTGPVSAEVAMFKRDTHKSYKIQSNLINNRNEFDMKMYFNTPGSKVSRLLSANVLLKKNDKTLEMNLISPWKKGSFKGDVVDTRDLKRVSGVVLLDEKKEFKASAEMARSRKGNSFFYTPSLEIKADKMKPIGLKGSIEYRPSQSFESEITLSGVTKSPVVTKLSLMNKKVIVSMKASLSVEKKKEYVFESRLQTSKTKKAVKYRPFLSIRSPTKEYVAFGGSAEYKQGKALVVDLTLDQITTKPMKFFVRIRNAATKKSSRYQGKVDIRTPIFTTKMQSNFVMRGTKAVIVRSTIDYVVPRVVRDRVRLNGKINMASTKSMKAVKGTMDVMFKKAAFLNGNLAFNVQHNKKHSEAEVDFRYGPNKKDTSKRVYLQTILNHVRISKIKKTQIDVRSKAIVPVLGIDLQVKGAFAQQPNSLGTSLAFTAGKKHSYLTSISLKDKSKKLMSYIGEARLSYPGRDIVLTNDFTQSNAKKYLHKFSATFGSQSSLSTESIFRIIDKNEYEISTTVSLPKTKPFTLSGQVKLNKQNFHTAGQLKSGSDVYALSASSKYRYGSLIDLSTDIKYPSRRITAALEARNKRPLYSSRLEVNWDADKGTSQRFQLKGDVTFDNIDNIAAELSKTCPKGKVKFSMKHTGGKQYITHADLEWDEKKQMSLDTSFQVSNGVKSASLKVRSPFKNFRSIAISADHNEKRVETKSMITVDWKPLKQISSVLTMKKPISLSNIEGNLELKTPFKGFETSSVDIKHQLKDSYKATIKTALNQAYVQMEIGGSSSGILNAMLDLQTNIGPITSLAIAAKHAQTGNKLENSATLKVNGHAYRYSGEMTHYRYGWQLQNNGRLTLSTPTRKFENVWSHRNTGKEMRSTMRSDMDGQIAEYTVNANQNMAFDQGAMSVGITIKSPFDQMKNTDFSLSHEHRHGFMDTTIRINHNKQSRLSFTNNYLRTPEQTTSSIEIVANRKNMALKSSSKYGTYPVTGSTELTVNGRSIGLLDGSLNIDKDSLLNGNLGVQSDSLPSMRMSLSQNKERGELVTRTTLEYGKRQPIVLEKRYQWGRKKSIALVMTTPFASLQRLTMGSEFTGNMDSFHSAANFQLQPTVGPISASAQWSTYGGYLANLRLDTPYDNLSSVKFSAKSEMKGQDRKSDLSIEYLKSKFIKIESSLRPVLKDLNGYIKMKTHFQEVPFIGAAIRHNGDLKAFVSHGEIEYASGKKMEADVSFTNADKIDGSVTLRTPFSSDLTARINHEGDISACKTSGFLQYSRSKQIDIRTTFKNRANLEGTLMIKSPFTEDISASVNSGKQVGLVDVHIEGKYGLAKKYEGDMKYSNTDKFQSSLELKSPHHDDIIIKVEHSGQMSRFSCHAEGQYGKQKKYEGDLSHSFDGNLLTFASFKSPHHSDISGKIEHTGNYKQFSSHVETQYGNDKYEGDVTFNNAKKFDVAVILKSPGRKDMSVAFSHEGSLKKFRTSSSLNLTPKAKFNIDVLFSNAKKTFGSFTLKSPMLPKIDAQLKHKGDLKNLDSSFEVKVNKQKKLGIDIGFANKKRMVGTLKIVSPVFEDINMKMVHKGRSTNFKLSPSMSVGKNKYSCDFTFKAKPSIKMTLSAVTPHKGFKKIKADLTHSGTLKSFKSQTSFALGKEKYSGNVKFTLRPNLIIDIDAETPLKGLKKVGAAITHQGTWDNFKCHGEITKGKSKELNGDIEFAIKPFSAFLSLQTPFKKLENTEVSIAHTGGLQKFQNKLKVVALRGKTIEMATNVDTVKDINTDVILKTPFKGLELVSGSFSHSGSWMNFHTHAELDNGSPNKYTGDIKLSTDRQINGEVTVRTPVAGYETLSLALSHDGTANNFRLHGEIQCNIDKSEADITFSSMGKIEGELIVKSPYIKTVKASISAKPSPYSGKILATYGKKELVKFISMLNNEKDIKGSASLNTWLSKEFRTTLSHEGSMKKFRTQLELAYGNNKIQTDTSLDASSDVLARTTIRTPFRGYETLSASASFTGNLRNLRSHADVSVNDKMVETEFTLSTENPITGSLAIRTPFSSLREMVGSIKHSGRPLNFKSHAEYSLNGKKAEADIVFDVLGDIKISGSLKHPSIQDVTFQVNHNGQRNDFRSHVELIYRGMKQVNGDISFSISPSIEFSCKLDANCPIIRNIDIAVTHKGPKRNFVSSAAITFNGEKIDGELHLDSRNGVDGRVILRTPIAEDIIVTMVHKGDARNFRSEGDLVFGNSNQYHAELTLNAMSKLEINSKLNTPDETYSLGLNHEGDLSAFKLSSFLTYGSDKRIQVNTNFDQSDKIFGQLTASAPFLSDVEVEFGHSGKSDNFRTSGFVKYGGNEEIGTDITFGSRSAKKGSLSLRRLGSKVDIVFSHDGSFPNIESTGKISHNGKRIVGLDIKLQNSNGFTGSATLKTASSEWKKTIISVRNIMNSDKISNEVEITYGRNKKIESDVEVTFTSPFKGSFIVKSPFDGFEESRASYIISPSSSGFQGHAEIKIFGQNAAIDTSLSQLKSIDGSMTITSSLPGLKDFRASFSHEGRGNYVLSHAESAYNGEKISSDLKLDARSDINGFLKIITPFDSMKRQTMTIRHSETESYAEIECLNEKISGKLERSNGRMKLSLQSPFQGFEDQELMYNKDGSVTHVEGIFRGEKAELDVTIGNSDISVVAKTPFKGYEEQKVAYRNDGTTRHIEGIYNNKKIEGDLSFSPNLVEVVIRTPFKGFEEQRSTYSFDGTTRHIEVIFRNQKFEGDIVFTPRRVMVLARSPIIGFEEQRLLYTSDDSTYHIEGIFQGRKAEADLLVSPERMEIVTKSPFRGYEEQRALYNYDGSAHHVEGIFRGEKIEADLLISRRMMEISIKSPFTGFESQKISYSNDGRTKRIEVTFRGNKANAELTITPDMTEAIVKSPFDGFKEQKLLYRNDGTTKHLEGTFRKQKAEADLTFTSGLIEIIVKTPFRGYTKQRALYRNDGNKLHLEGLFNGQGAEADVSMGPSDIEIVLQTPFKGYETQRLTINHELTRTSCNCKIEGVFRGDKVEGAMLVSWADSIEGKITMQSSFKGFRDQYLQFNFDKSFESYNGHIEGMFDNEKLEVDTSLSSDDGKTIRLSAKTPFKGFENQNVVLSYSSTPQSVSSRAEVSVSGEKYEIDLTVEPKKLGSITIKTPISGYEETKASYVFSSSPSELRSRADILYQGQVSSVDASLKTGRKIEGELSVSTPFKGYEKSKMSFSHKMTKVSLLSTAAVEYGNDKRIEARAQANLRGKVDGRISLKTPVRSMENTELSVSYQVSNSKLQSHVEALYGDSQKMSGDCVLSLRDSGFDANTVIETPFFEETKLSIVGSWNPDITFHSEAAYGTDKIEADFSLDNSDPLTMSGYLKTPIEGFETTTLTFNKQGNLKNLNMKGELVYGEAQTISATLKNHVSSGRTESSFTLTTPYSEDLNIRYELNGDFSSFTSDFEATFGSDYSTRQQTSLRLHSMNIDFQTTSSLIIPGNSKTVVTALRNVGELPNFDTEARVVYNNQPALMKMSIKVDKDVTASILVQTPFDCMRDIQSGFSFIGDKSQFTSNMNLKYNEMDKIEGKLDFFVYKLRRLNVVLDIKTPFSGYEQTVLTLKHHSSKKSLKSFAEAKYGHGSVVRASIKAMSDPKELEITVETPIENYEVMSIAARHSRIGNKVDTSVTASKAQQKIEFTNVMDFDSNPLKIETKFLTPFRGLESTEISINTNVDINNLRTEVEAKSSSLATTKASLQWQYVSPSNINGIATFTRGSEITKLIVNNRENGNEITSHVQGSWLNDKSVTFDGTWSLTETWNGLTGHGGVALSTPFSYLKSFSSKVSFEKSSTQQKHSMSTEFNGNKIVDIETLLSYGDKYAMEITLREPTQLKIDSELTILPSRKSTSVMLNWDTSRDDKQVKMEGEYSTERGNTELKVKVSNTEKSVALKGSFQNPSAKLISTMDILVDDKSIFGYDYECKNERSRRNLNLSNKLKLRLPSRSLEVAGGYSNRYGTKSLEGAFAWDSDRDNSKKIGFKSSLTPRGQATSAAVSVEMPSIGQDVKLDSEMMINSGSVIFDGKTEFKYSKDTTKTLVIKSRLEDISYGDNKNYTLTFGLQHSYTNVDVQVASHVGQTDGRYSTGVDVKYLTAKRQTKNFALMAEIDSLKKQMNMMVKSPMKTIQMSGEVKTSSPYTVRVSNLIDEKYPLNTELLVDIERKRIGLQMNYDLDNPNNIFRMNAKYVNDSAISAEIFREENSRKILDSLLALRLNTSHILHTRLHWRPSMLQDIKDAGIRKLSLCSSKLNSAITEAAAAVSEELNTKYNLVRQSASQDFRPYANFLQQILSELNKQVIAISKSYDLEVLNQISKSLLNANDMLENLKTVTRKDFPYKAQYDLYVEATKELIKVSIEESKLNYARFMDVLKEQLKELSVAVEKAHLSYQGMVSSLSKYDINEQLSKKFQQLKSQIVESDFSSSMAEKYASSIYNVRDVLAKRLDVPMLSGVKGVSKDALKLATDAYKFWEVQENIKAVLDKIYEMAVEEVKEEINGLKNVITHLKNSKFTVYDPANGEIQMDSYLPVGMPNLKTLPSVSVSKQMNHIASYIPNFNRFPAVKDVIPDTDVRNWIPPFKGVAVLAGEHITTFDGKEIDINGGKCSYILTRDYLDGNFSIIANYVGKGQKKLVITTATQNIQIAPNGKLRVDGKTVKPSYQSAEVSISKEDDIITVWGNGFRADVDIPKDIVIIQISGWYHNRLGGLLGTLNNERYDDMMTSSRKITSDSTYLANTWSVCR